MSSADDDATPATARQGRAGAGSKTDELSARIARRVAAAHAGQPLDRLLAEDLPGNALTTLLLHALRQRALRRSPADVLEHAERAPLTHASTADARRLHAFDGAAFAAAARFEAVDLAPVVPLGATACAGIEPNNVLAAVRFAEVAADPTTGLWLHAARRRREARGGEPLRLCASQRVVRMQPLTQPGFTPHFRLFALLTAVRSRGRGDDEACERAALLEHLLVWADVVRALPAAGFRTAGLRVVLSDTSMVRACLGARGLDADAMARRAKAHEPGSQEAALREAGVALPRAAADLVGTARALGLGPGLVARAERWVAEVAEPLARARPEVEIVYDLARLQGLGYYAGPFIQLVVRRDDGLELPAGDGGALPWLGALLSDRRERMIATGVGSELLVKLFDRSMDRADAARPEETGP
ncbi:hypothetical protein SOCEGT47_011490 [Sorangium cellulosum]|uniref:ATP phosphoribosyltransferase regulatory subunit n=1 Tax=Sorangium cellulosum TaxID=56 RepID=A0A4P2PW23_SORCE|nr:hypothetical protein [Sorangium cellulosum]AUX20676.1 hypothetical protein SOCEGT47_011490 [Sorangium cellulosum]